MIQITYEPRYHSLRVRGHAGQAPKGQDIVCAGVSSLVVTLAKYVAQHCERPMVDLSGGDTFISGVTFTDSAEATAVYAAVVSGLQEIANTYPEYVAVKIF